ncbi:hypothetical protein Q767_05340 [Flavobacterium enshiense DK69]|uniref:Uncharacterized protein n=1 Tax=Flavobacterium enshiense DK69 TaxID=1107311 RepID=A0A0A2MY21_9FLAO|nr:hypothetical protein Q767_05340 [Flavobacterium enshiense DK69]
MLKKKVRKNKLHILQKFPKRPLLQIVKVFFVSISFPFKTDIPIGYITISTLKPTKQKFNTVPKKKRQYQQLQLLSDVDHFMVDNHLILPILFIRQKNKRKKGDSSKAFRR